MALSGQLSDLSLAELIEFFCNQRKTGRLKIAYQRAPGYFYFERGELVDAKIGALTGVEAVYYALTQENASFKFSTAFEATRRTIHQPWTHVALEGLRRLDEGVTPKEAFPDGVMVTHDEEPEEMEEKSAPAKVSSSSSPSKEVESNEASPLSLMVESSNERGRSRTLVYAAVIAALVLSVAAIGFPAGWYGGGKRKVEASAQSSVAQPETKTETVGATESNQSDAAATQTEGEADTSGGAANTNIFAVRQQQEREREARERALAAQDKANAQAAKQNAPVQNPQVNLADVKKPEPAKPASKSVTVQVTYDENGRVTQASGGDGMAQRIARQKRFPTGKGGTTTVTIPVN
jgi:hypothetical protein